MAIGVCEVDEDEEGGQCSEEVEDDVCGGGIV